MYHGRGNLGGGLVLMLPHQETMGYGAYAPTKKNCKTIFEETNIATAGIAYDFCVWQYANLNGRFCGSQFALCIRKMFSYRDMVCHIVFVICLFQ